MSWQIVVAALIVVAIAVHFGERHKARSNLAKRRARELAARDHLHELSYTRDIREEWSADLRAMLVQVSRTEAGSRLGEPERLELERDANGAWAIKGSAAAPKLPGRLAEQLEKRHQHLTSQTKNTL